MNELTRLLAIDPELAPMVWPLAVAWVLVLGSAIGSFLNVVIYRLPEGKSLSYPGSRCPRCGHSIRGYDNIPVLSWLILRGRCRDCEAPISARYPIVEAVVALMFVSVVTAGPLSLSADRPSGWGQCAYHLTALCVLFSAALIHYDGKPLPRKLAIFAVLVGFGGVLVWPQLHDGPMSFVARSVLPSMAALCGAALGAALGGLARGASRGITRDRPSDNVLLMLIVGLFFGWRGVAVVAICVAVVDLVICLVASRLPAIGKIPRSGLCLLATFALSCGSRPLAVFQSTWLGGEEFLLPAALVTTAVCVLIARPLARKGSGPLG